MNARVELGQKDRIDTKLVQQHSLLRTPLLRFENHFSGVGHEKVRHHPHQVLRWYLMHISISGSKSQNIWFVPNFKLRSRIRKKTETNVIRCVFVVFEPDK